MYSYNTRISFSESDEKLELKIPALLNFFQDAAIFEAEEGSINMEYLQERHLAWLLGSWQIVIERRPRLGERVIVSTTPYAFKGFIGYRNFTLTTESSEILAKAASIWTLVDIEKMRPARPSEEILAGYEIGPKLEMEYEPRRIDLAGEGTPREPFFIRQNQIDSNHHVNNEEYVNMAMEYLDESCFTDDVSGTCCDTCQWKSDPYAVNIDGTAVECGDYLSGKYKAGERKV